MSRQSLSTAILHVENSQIVHVGYKYMAKTIYDENKDLMTNKNNRRKNTFDLSLKKWCALRGWATGGWGIIYKFALFTYQDVDRTSRERWIFFSRKQKNNKKKGKLENGEKNASIFLWLAKLIPISDSNKRFFPTFFPLSGRRVENIIAILERKIRFSKKKKNCNVEKFLSFFPPFFFGSFPHTPESNAEKCLGVKEVLEGR